MVRQNEETCQGGNQGRPDESKSSDHARDKDPFNNSPIKSSSQDLPPIVYRVLQANYGKPRTCIFCGAWTQNLAVFESYKTAKWGISETSTRYFFYGVCDCCSDKYSLNQIEQKLTEMCRTGEM